MNIYLLGRTTLAGYDNYDSAVVVAESEEQEKSIHPNGTGNPVTNSVAAYETWVPIEQVSVELIGTAKPYVPGGVICASFNAG